MHSVDRSEFRAAEGSGVTDWDQRTVMEA